MKKAIRILAVNTLGFIALLIVLELLTRLFNPSLNFPRTDHKLFKDNVYNTSKGLNPNTAGLCYGHLFRVNNNGFWKYSNQNNGRKKILFLGDSVTMGIGVEQDSTFAGIINNETDYEVCSPSAIGMSGKDYLNIVKSLTEDSTNRFSAVFLFWCLNDIYDVYPDQETPDMRNRGLLSDALDFFRNHFKLYHFLKDAFADRPKVYYKYDEQFYKHLNTLFSSSLNYLNEISIILRSNKIPYKIFLLPYEYQLREGLFKPQKMLADSLSASGNLVNNISSIFKKEGDPKDLYLYGDGIHFSEKGHRFIAEFIKTRIPE